MMNDLEIVLTMIAIAGVVGIGAFVWTKVKKGTKGSDPKAEPKEEAKEETKEEVPGSSVPSSTTAEMPDPKAEPKTEPEVDPAETKAAEVVDEVLTRFNPVINVSEQSMTFDYLVKVATEAWRQFYKGESGWSLPLLYRPELFPTITDIYQGVRDEDAAFRTLVGWVCALHLSELCPMKRNELMPIGYSAGGYSAESDIFGYEFRSDPTVARLIGGSLLAVMHGVAEPDIEGMRSEVGGKGYDRTLEDIVDQESRYNVADDGFYIDFRRFMVSAPGPYAPGYQDRSQLRGTFTDEKVSNGCLAMDMKIHEVIVSRSNLPGQLAVQAVADKEWDEHHLYGDDRRDVGGLYDFHAVFGQETIDMRIDPECELAQWIAWAKTAGSNARGILQHANSAYGPIEYGRLRPGCSWTQEATKHSQTDDRENALANFVIEDGDGCPTGYYDENGVWTKPQECSSPEQYEEMQKRNLFANSYPSGHSGGITCAAMMLMEAYPYRSDRILKAANSFSLNRSVSRYHWTSDVLQGRLVGSAMSAICRAARKG